MRLIDADALPKYTGYALSAIDVAKAVENAPTVDAVPIEDYKSMERTVNKLTKAITEDHMKHGHWIEVQRIHEKDHTAICECSLCGDTVWVYDGQRAWNYCPNCGAKMDEVEDETS